MNNLHLPCDAAQFMDRRPDAGLQRIEPDVAHQYEQNYRALVDVLTSADSTAGGTLSAETLKTLLYVQGYYLGKEQLTCLFRNDFAEFRGIQIRLGLTKPIDSNSPGNLIYLVRGQFLTYGPDLESIFVEGMEPIDGRFGQLSEVVFMAGIEPEVDQPDPPAYPNPPYGSATE